MVTNEVPLQDWFEAHPVRDEMFWKGSAEGQVMFVRDKIAGLFFTGLDYEVARQCTTVISSHHSKSIELPVYQLARPDRGLRIILRDNFYNWKLSVINDYPVVADFDGLFHTTPPLEPDYTGDELSPVYFEGFPRELVFGYYEESDKCRFSAEIQGDYALWTTIFLLLRALGLIQPFKWHTRASHQEELARKKA